jgi:hypothetical protein
VSAQTFSRSHPLLERGRCDDKRAIGRTIGRNAHATARQRAGGRLLHATRGERRTSEYLLVITEPSACMGAHGRTPHGGVSGCAAAHTRSAACARRCEAARPLAKGYLRHRMGGVVLRGDQRDALVLAVLLLLDYLVHLGVELRQRLVPGRARDRHVARLHREHGRHRLPRRAGGARAHGRLCAHQGSHRCGRAHVDQ